MGKERRRNGVNRLKRMMSSILALVLVVSLMDLTGWGYQTIHAGELGDADISAEEAMVDEIVMEEPEVEAVGMDADIEEIVVDEAAEDAVSATAGAFTVTGGTSGTDYSYSSGVLTISSDKELTIANVNPGVATTDRIEIASGANANVILAGVNIEISTKHTCAFKIADNSTGDVTVTLAAGTVNILKSGNYCAGLQKVGSAETVGELTIRGEGELQATGGSSGAGIGSNPNTSARNIVIDGGIITAIGGEFAVGIGGGGSGSGINIQIRGGRITATGKSGGIGGGSASDNVLNGNAVVFSEGIGKLTGFDQGLVKGVLFEGNAGTVYGDVMTEFSWEIPGGKTLTIPSDAFLAVARGTELVNSGKLIIGKSSCLSGNGVLSGTGSYYTQELTSDMITVPAGLKYTGADLTSDAVLAIKAEKTVMGNAFSVSADWEKSIREGTVIEAGTYTAQYNRNDVIIEKEFTVAKANLISLTQPVSFTDIQNATERETIEQMLPDTVEISTEAAGVVSADVVWDLAAVTDKYDPAVLTEQTFTVEGAAVLPASIAQNNVSLAVSIDVTVLAADVTAAPLASLEEGTYTSARSVELTSSTEGAKIYYTMTTNGTEPKDPAVSDTKYTEAIVVNGSAGNEVKVWIKAVAVRDGMQMSPVSSFTYGIKIPAQVSSTPEPTESLTPSAASPILNLKATPSGRKVKLIWNKIADADGYYIYGAENGRKLKKIKTITKGSTTTWTQKGRSKSKDYKYTVKAYQKVGNSKKVIVSSIQVYVAMSGSKYTNVKKVSVNFTRTTLAKGRTKKIKATATKQKKSRKLLSRAAKFRYVSNNTKVATVSKSGKIKAVGTGSCYIYIYANNGVYKRLTIYVK